MKVCARILTILAVAAAAMVATVVPASAATVQNLVGDMDNFGYGVGNSVPCAYFDNREPEDIGVFDFEGIGNQTKNWTHNLSLPAGATVTSVVVEVREIFSDPTGSDQIVIDGTTLPFNINGNSNCGPAISQVFEFTGVDAAFAADGTIDIQFLENGDDIALDYSQVTVEYSAGSDGATTGLTVTPNGSGPGRAAVSVTVANVGQTTFTAPVTVTVTAQSGGSPWTSAPQNVTLRPGERRTLQFVALKPSGPASSSYTTRACIRAPGDTRTANDCMSRTGPL